MWRKKFFAQLIIHIQGGLQQRPFKLLGKSSLGGLGSANLALWPISFPGLMLSHLEHPPSLGEQGLVSPLFNKMPFTIFLKCFASTVI